MLSKSLQARTVGQQLQAGVGAGVPSAQTALLAHRTVIQFGLTAIDRCIYKYLFLSIFKYLTYVKQLHGQRQEREVRKGQISCL